jgi:hypothetical protein
MLLVVLIIAIGVFVWAAVDAFTADPDKVKGLPKAVWLVLILFTSIFLIGAIAWFLFGRPRNPAMSRVARGTGRGNANGPTARRTAPVAPDDDPEFLMRLRDQLRNKPDDDPRA